MILTMKCAWVGHSGFCEQELDDGSVIRLGRCPFHNSDTMLECDLFASDDSGKVAAMEKRAAWQDVAAKGTAIFKTNGVDIVREDASEVEAFVTSAQVADAFPVEIGGPYDTILSKRSWENKNVGGWVQGYLCDCTWGSYHSGDSSGGGRFAGRFCSHAYATLLAANMRARRDFMDDRRAKVAKIIAECDECGKVAEISPTSGLCDDCYERKLFDSVVAAKWGHSNEQQRTAHRFLADCCDVRDMNRVEDEIETQKLDAHTAVLKWHGYRAIVNCDARVASRKDATRHFTYAEMEELDKEIDGKELHNHIRLRDYPEEF